MDKSWFEPTSSYMQQVYEYADPNTYISTTRKQDQNIDYVHHIKKGFTLVAFQETQTVRFVAPPELEKFITKYGEKPLKLSSELILLRRPETGSAEKSFNAQKEAEKKRAELKASWKDEKGLPPNFIVYELFNPGGEESFSIGASESNIQDWVDQDYVILDQTPNQRWHQETGVIYIHNPIQYRVSSYKRKGEEGWHYDPKGQPVNSLQELTALNIGFKSRKELIEYGEDIFRIEGCWYCHTDQTRTLIQDVVLNGSASYPAPPSSANEYIYQRVTFPGTKRNGPDLSRVGIKRPNRDWHKSHFWSPRTESAGSIMPSFQHFFDNDPRGTSRSDIGIPNIKFEAVFQYLMTKGTRINPPTEAWWLGKDPVHTKEIIEGRKTLP